MRSGFIVRRSALALALVSVATVAFSESTVDADVQSDAPRLDAKVRAEYSAGGVYLYVVITNNSEKTACVGDRAFAETNNGVEIWDAAGHELAQNPSGYPFIKNFHSVNYAEPFNVLLPGQQFDKTVDVKYFPLTRGVYTYQWIISYYTCRDIVDLKRVTSSNAQVYPIVLSGQFRFRPAHD